MRGSQPPAPKPKKWLGQNFLRDERILRRILDAAGLKKTDVVLEIGPGTGILTKALAARVKKVIAVEKDPHMVEILKEELKNFNNVEIVLGDILDTKYQI
ncbi:MAG: methyltransferase domain-containing protein, partial [Candidatus Wildermuthbacteria bacterium]|nr:methyltransferase domain-containing protein [Candidatus Wildermuthbacteria bacterium]